MGYVIHYQSPINIYWRPPAVGRITPNSLRDAKNTREVNVLRTRACTHLHTQSPSREALEEGEGL